MISRLAKFPLLMTLLVAGALGQSPAPTATPQLSPQAAYDEVLRPLEITRRSIANWSDSETNALGIAVKQAMQQCIARSPDQFKGDDLIAYAHLCSLGQQWTTVSTAASLYINSVDPNKPQLAQAYAFQVDATLHSNNPKAALASSEAMLHAVPYDALTDATINEALHYLQLAFTEDALTLYAVRQPILLAALRTTQHVSASTVPIHTLYADGLAFAALQQFEGKREAAAATVAELDAALAAAPNPLLPDDSIPIADSRRQYALLGTPLPAISLTQSLFARNETPRIDTNYGLATVLLLFPDWCAQCVRMGSSFLPALFRLNGNGADVHLYGLLAQPPPPKPVPIEATLKRATNPVTPAEPETSKTPAEQLSGTPTLIVSPQTITQFVARDFPLLIVTDHKGIIRFIQPAPDTALNPGDFLDQVVAHIAQQWPAKAPAKTKSVPPASAQGPSPN